MNNLASHMNIAVFGFIDKRFITLVLLLLIIGLVTLMSASIDYAQYRMGDPFYFFKRQVIFALLAIGAGAVAYSVPIAWWYRYGWVCLFVGLFLLLVVLIPGIGREVNGSRRWIPLGIINFQCSEAAKFLILVYLAGYLVRRKDEVSESWQGFARPVLVIFVAVFLLLMEPDFGSSVVLVVAAMTMLFLGGVGIMQFMILIGSALSAMFLMAIISPYRLQRLNCFLDPWERAFDCGYQLTQALIAFGRGDWLGLGLGQSIQKQFYLPEAHTDFIFSILAEEMGMFGVFGVLVLFLMLVMTVFWIGFKAQKVNRLFCAYYCYGVGALLGIQVFFNVGVNTGLLPTKGLTLPLFSYGGSSLLMMFVMLAVIARISSDISSLNARSANESHRGLRS